MKNRTILKLVQTAVLLAILLILNFTPLGYLKIGIFEISLLTIPVVIGAMIVGPASGAVLGLAFGVTSYLQCFGPSAFGTTLNNINPFAQFIVCVPTRVLMGWLTGVIFKGLKAVDKTKTVCYFASGLIGALLNTILFMGALVLFFWRSDYIQSMAQSAGAENIFAFIIAMVGLNGIVEMAASCIIGGGVSKVLSRVMKHSSDGEYVSN